MKKGILITLAILVTLFAARIIGRTEIDFGRVLNNQGDGKLYNGEAFYNYCYYDADRFHENDIVLTVCFLNPFNNYCDDILIRSDFTFLRNVI